MIDFTSTAQGIDDQSKRCAQFVAAIIAQAIRDLSMRPTATERRQRLNLLTDAYESAKFFCDEDSPFKHYAFMVGMDPQAFLHNLEKRSFTTEREKKYSPISYRDARIMRVRLGWYRLQKVMENNARPKRQRNAAANKLSV